MEIEEKRVSLLRSKLGLCSLRVFQVQIVGKSSSLKASEKKISKGWVPATRLEMYSYLLLNMLPLCCLISAYLLWKIGQSKAVTC